MRWERGGELDREVVPNATVSLVVSALTRSIGRGGNRRAAGPLGSDTWWCCRGRRWEQSLQDSGRTYGDPQEGGRSSIHSTASSPSLICSKWERLVQLLDVISQALGVEARKGFSSKRRSVSSCLKSSFLQLPLLAGLLCRARDQCGGWEPAPFPLQT